MEGEAPWRGSVERLSEEQMQDWQRWSLHLSQEMEMSLMTSNSLRHPEPVR